MPIRARTRSVAYAFDAQTGETLRQIRESLRLGSDAEVLSVAIELLGVATKVLNAGGSLLIRDQRGRQKELVLA